MVPQSLIAGFTHHWYWGCPHQNHRAPSCLYLNGAQKGPGPDGPEHSRPGLPEMVSSGDGWEIYIIYHDKWKLSYENLWWKYENHRGGSEELIGDCWSRKNQLTWFALWNWANTCSTNVTWAVRWSVTLVEMWNSSAKTMWFVRWDEL